MLPSHMNRKYRHWPARGWVGAILVAVCWPLNWMLPGGRTAYLFFPLWLGYIFVVDALVWKRLGHSLWSRSRKGFVLLFVVSAPVWWLFELINLRTGNWEYSGGRVVRSAPIRPALDDFIFNGDSRRVRNRRADAELRLDATFRFRAAHSGDTRNVCRPVRRRPCDAFGNADLAENFLSIRMDVAGLYF